MELSSNALSDIRGFRRIGDALGTAGQPTEEQLRAVRDTGFEAVVNLALPTSDNALANEGGIVTGLGMIYVHIPVNFQKPMKRDFDLFCRVMDALEGHRVFVHCAANMRVSAFVFLHRVLHQHCAIAEAERDLLAIWRPDDVWSRFIEDRLRGVGDMSA